MKKQSWMALSVAIGLGVLLVYFSQPIAHRLSGLFFKQSAPMSSQPSAIFASIESSTGPVFIRTKERLQNTPAKIPQSIRHHDQISATGNTIIEVHFQNGWVINLTNSPQAEFQLFHPFTQMAPALISLKQGDFEVAKMGRKNQLFIMQNKKIFVPELKPKNNVRQIAIQKPIQNMVAPTTASAQSENVVALEDTTPTPPPAMAHSQKSTATQTASHPEQSPIVKLKKGETLTDAYIEQILDTQVANLRRCQMNSLRDNTATEGELLLSLTIEPTGQMQKIRVLQDAIRNEQLSNCVTSTLRRTQFKAFAGEPITLTYPIQFK